MTHLIFWKKFNISSVMELSEVKDFYMMLFWVDGNSQKWSQVVNYTECNYTNSYKLSSGFKVDTTSV